MLLFLSDRVLYKTENSHLSTEFTVKTNETSDSIITTIIC